MLGITLFAFVLLQALPGDPVLSLVGERANPETIEQIRKEIGTDKGPVVQYLGYVNLLVKGNFGRSYYTNRDVLTDITLKFPNTLRLAFAAMLIAVPLGVMSGLIVSYRKGWFARWVFDLFSIGGLSVPVFWSAIIFMMVLSLKLKVFPPSGTGGLRFMLLPAIVLSIPAMATLARVTRTAVADVLTLPHVTAAKAKGLSRGRVSVVHVLKNALVPIVTVIGLDFGSYLNGAVVTETVFGWDGVGRFTMEGILKRDYPVILGCIITGTAIFVVVNLLTDVLYHWLDPRIRFRVKER